MITYPEENARPFPAFLAHLPWPRYNESEVNTLNTDALRIDMRHKRDAWPFAERARASLAIAERIKEEEAYAAARTIALFYPFGSEVDTRPLIHAAWAADKIVLLPVCMPERRLLFCNYAPHTPLKPQAFGLMEIPVEARVPVDAQAIDLVIVPGLLFDAWGGRIGYGGGYYDRFLATLPPSTAQIAIAFELQVQKTEPLPQAAHDRPMALILTESGRYPL